MFVHGTDDGKENNDKNNNIPGCLLKRRGGPATKLFDISNNKNYRRSEKNKSRGTTTTAKTKSPRQLNEIDVRRRRNECHYVLLANVSHDDCTSDRNII